MNELAFWYYIRSDLPPDAQSPASLGSKFLETLDALGRIDSTVFPNWEVMDFRARDSLPLAAARPRIAAMIENNVKRDDFRRPQPERGYTAGAFISNVMKSRGISLRIHSGGNVRGNTWLETGDWDVLPDPAIVTYPVYKAALLAINAIWPGHWACAQAYRLGYDKVPLIPGVPLFPYSRFHMPWLAYLSAPLAAGIELPPEIMTERTPDGGLLTIATEERLEPTNPDHLRRAQILAETMIARTGYSSS
jgi:hypothetical protein